MSQQNQNHHANQIFSRAPIYETILSELSPRQLIRTSWACQTAHDAVQAFIHHEYDVNRHLSRYFSDPLAFRSLQARTGTLISGSNALQFLDRSLYPEADLDVYTHSGHTLEVLDWLTEKAGYRFAPPEDRPTSSFHDIAGWSPAHRFTSQTSKPSGDYGGVKLRGLAHVFHYIKDSKDGGEPLRIQVMESEVNPLGTVLFFHSTCVMNIIAFDCAYSLYPVATYEERKSLLTIDQGVVGPVEKYTERGWEFCKTDVEDAKDIGSKPSLWYPGVERSVQDRYTWRVPLDVTGVAQRSPPSVSSKAVPWDPMVSNTWKMIYVKFFGRLAMGVSCVMVKSITFRYDYFLSDETLVKAMVDSGYVVQPDRQSVASRFVKLARMDEWPWLDGELPRYCKQAKEELERQKFIGSRGVRRLDEDVPRVSPLPNYFSFPESP
ncbi:hypothetical protein CONPUDRAFT_168000 [Coniophora puteana RWD-64-598 SS2]|uniref:Uncharacterized protein n=1 Tax=Coniophora puteana (strain RWD-64-598) TaxID=741705 RepID=A0A5M3MFK7_CONPW|nr:uncharacterized protein CONPUDRAFT_168000 [Coniophora puteana RWD-64-598 SS2]EIW78038.1 hypothetical protein CONPUDRAFT_168000 [Coniophora puteana RWD-64-598 SS2]